MKRALVVGCAVSVLWLASPTATYAQEQPFQSYEAGAWFLTALELTLIAEIPLSLAVGEGVDGNEALKCSLLLPLCLLFTPQHAGGVLVVAAVFALDAIAAIVVPSVSAAVADAVDAPVDFPIVFTTGLSGAISMAFLGGGVGATGGAGAVGALIGAAVGLGGGLTYSLLRLEPLARDPRVGVEVNFLMWAPATLGPLALAIATMAGADSEVVAIVGGIAGLLSVGLSILAIEVALSEPLPPPMPAPLLSSPALRF